MNVYCFVRTSVTIPMTIVAAALLILAGCQGPSSANAGTTKTTTSGAPEPVAAKPDQPQDILVAEEQQKNSDGSRKIPERLYQLSELKKAKIKVGEHVLEVWVVDTELKRQEGMMFLRSGDFTEKQGFLFVFAYEQPLRFWMKNTLVDLDIAYIGANKAINSIYTMKSLDTITDYSSRRASMYALEVKDGWFARNKVPVGTKVEIPKDIKSDE